MSSEQDKDKHSKRLHQKETHVAKQVKTAKAFGIPVQEPHRLAKHKLLDCGVPGCPLCGNPRTISKEKTIQEKKFEQTERWDD